MNEGAKKHNTLKEVEVGENSDNTISLKGWYFKKISLLILFASQYESVLLILQGHNAIIDHCQQEGDFSSLKCNLSKLLRPKNRSNPDLLKQHDEDCTTCINYLK